MVFLLYLVAGNGSCRRLMCRPASSGMRSRGLSGLRANAIKKTSSPCVTTHGDEAFDLPRGATPFRLENRPTKNPCVKRKDCASLTRSEAGANAPSSSALITVASPGSPTGMVPSVGRPTPRSIHCLRSCLLSTSRRLSGTRFDNYSSGS